MPIDLKEFERLRKTQREAAQGAERAQGALEREMEALSDEFGVDDLAAAKRLLSSMKKEAEELEASYNEAKDAFEAELQAHIE